MTMPATCAATTKDGRPCAGRVLPGSSWCRFHDPALEDERRSWSRRGGAAKSNRERARKQLGATDFTAADLRGTLALVLAKTIRGDLAPGVATATATVARAWVAVNEMADLIQRIEALEEQAEQRRGA